MIPSDRPGIFSRCISAVTYWSTWGARASAGSTVTAGGTAAALKSRNGRNSAGSFMFLLVEVFRAWGRAEELYPMRRALGIEKSSGLATFGEGTSRDIL